MITSESNVKVNGERGLRVSVYPRSCFKDGRTDRQRLYRSHPLLSEGCGFALAAVIDLQKISVVE